MDIKYPTFKLPGDETGGLAACRRELQQWWRGLPAGVRSPVWPGILATLIIFGLLLAFHQVVTGAVQQSELRLKATAMRSEATWRCNTLRGLGASESCRSQLKALADGNALLQFPNTAGVRQPNAQAVLMTNLDLLSDR